MDWHKRFKSKGCILKMKAASKEEALNEVVDQLASSKLLPATLEDDARAALHAREELAPTGVGMNVAIPHVKLEGLEEAVFSLSVAPEGLEWQAVDGAPVQIVFVVLRPDEPTELHDPEEHVEDALDREPRSRRGLQGRSRSRRAPRPSSSGFSRRWLPVAHLTLSRAAAFASSTRPDSRRRPCHAIVQAAMAHECTLRIKGPRGLEPA